MSELPRLGVRLPNSGPFATAENLLRVADAAVSAGFEALWVHDHISWPQDKLTHFAMGSIEVCHDQPSNFFESISTCGLLAGRYPEVQVGVAGLVLPLRDPRVLGKQLATLHHLTGSHMVVCPVIGNIPNDFDVMGIAWNKRGAITREYLGALRAVLSQEQPCAFEGSWVSWKDGTFLPTAPTLQLWVGGESDAGLRRAVDFGDGWMTVYASVEDYRNLREKLVAVAGESGRSLDGFQYAYETFVCVADTHDEAVAIARRTLESNSHAADLGEKACLIGTADEVLERITQYAGAGVQHIELKFICHDVAQMLGMLERIADSRRRHLASQKRAG